MVHQIHCFRLSINACSMPRRTGLFACRECVNGGAIRHSLINLMLATTQAAIKKNA
jgi:hypothetical protein